MFPDFSKANGTPWSEFRKNLTPYFADDLINDITNYEPLIAKYEIWSWDVGDFSGDGFTDLAMTAKPLSKSGRRMKILLFADVDGYITKVGEFEKKYIDLPLEVGVAIRENAIFITEKQKQFYWNIEGYSYINNKLSLVEDFTTTSSAGITKEISTGYFGRPSYTRFIATNNNIILFDYSYMSRFLFPKNRNFIETETPVKVDNVNNITEGAYWWDNWDDLSYSLNFLVHNDLLRIKIDVNDDKLLYLPFAESIDIYLSVGNVDRSPKKSNEGYSMSEIKIETMKFTLLPFNTSLVEYQGFVETNGQHHHNSSYTVTTDNGYTVYATISTAKLGATSEDLMAGKEIYYYIKVHDRDDPENLERVTILGTTKSNSENQLYWNTLRLSERDKFGTNAKTGAILTEYGLK